MNKKVIIIVAIIVILAATITLAVVLNKGDKKEDSTPDVKLETAQDMKDLINKIYTKLGDKLPSLEVFDVDKTDEFAFNSYTGLSSADKVDAVVVSEPMMNAQSYSFVLLKVAEGADIEAMKQEMFENIDTRKWICVSAEKLYVTNYNDVICLIMADADWADPVYNEFKTLVGGKVGKELTRTESEF